MEGTLTTSLPISPETGQAPKEALPPVGLSRRHLAVVFAGLLGLWLVGVFARQVGTASEAARQADQMAARNAAVQHDVAALQAEIQLIQRPAFVASMARGYLIGSPGEIPFTVQDRKVLPANAPGSVGIAAEPPQDEESPWDAWLRVLFGP